MFDRSGSLDSLRFTLRNPETELGRDRPSMQECDYTTHGEENTGYTTANLSILCNG